MTTTRKTGEVVRLELPARLCYSVYCALISSDEFKPQPLEDGVMSFWAENNVIHLYYKGNTSENEDPTS